MTDEHMTSFNQFIARDSAANKNLPGWMRDFQRPALKKFLDVGLPDKKVESWKYTNPKLFAKKEYVCVQAGGSVDKKDTERALLKDAIQLVFIDGILSADLSDLSKASEGVFVQELQSAIESGDRDLESILAGSEASESFHLMNDAFFRHGAFIKVAAAKDSLIPIQILNISSQQSEGSAVFPRNAVLIEEGARAVLFERFVGFNKDGFNNGLTQVKLQKNSHLDYYRVQTESEEALHFSQADVDLDEGSRLNMLSLDCGAKVARHDLNIRLQGAQATAHVDGVYLVHGKQHIDNHSIIDHQHAETFSSQTYKGALKDKSKAVFNGKIFVRRDAQLCNAHQINRNLMLSDEAEVDTKPELQLDANDIKCSHGATVGQLRDDEIFYLQSRAIPKKQAIKMLSRSYVADLVNNIPHAEIKLVMNDLLNQFFEEGS